MDIVALGWREELARAFEPHAATGLVPARVALEHKHAYELFAASGELTAELVGRLLKNFTRADLPAVGDWVAVEVPADRKRAKIHAVLPRRTRFSRRAAGERAEEQVIAANIDTVLLISGLDADFNPRRIERYLALARGSGALPVIVLNKSDLCAEAPERLESVKLLAGEAPVFLISAENGDGVDALAPYLGVGQTVALLGSSGVGKSTLANRLFGSARQSIGAVRAHDDRGKHTTTRRELIVLPGGALLVDTPGMRELQLWDSAREGLATVFPEIVELGGGCRFRDCRHGSEPDCAVRAALANGTLAQERFASFQKLRAELEARENAASSGSRSRDAASWVKGRRIMRS